MRDRLTAAADVLLGGMVVAVVCAIYLSGIGGRFALNSDIVMPYVMYADAVAGEHALSGWLLPESPYWFPDLLATWALRAAMPLLAAVNVFAFLQAGTWLLLARWVLGQLAPAAARLAWWLFVLAWLALVLTTLQVPDSWLDRLAQYLFVPSTHAGALLATLASLGLVLRMQRAPRDVAPAAVLALLATATVLSDRLYAVACLLPLLGLVALPILDRRVRVRAGSVALGVLAGSEAWRWWSGDAGVASRFAPVDTPAGSAAQVAKDLAVLFSSNVAGSAIVLAGLVALGIALARAVSARPRRAHDANATARAAAAAFIGCSVLLPLAASVALGRHTGLDSFRYDQTIGFLLLPLAWLLADVAARFGRGRAAWTAAGVVALSSAFAALHFDTSERALRDEWRAQADCIDRAHAQYGLHGGLSRYWHANSLTAMLASGASIYSLSPRLESMPVNNNLDWIGARAESAAAMPVIDFIDEYQFDPARLDQAFGAPRARIECPLSTIRVYDAAAGVLGALYRQNDWLPQDTLHRYGRMALPAALWAQPPAQARGDGLRAEGTFPLPTPVLLGTVETRRAVKTLWLDYHLVSMRGGSASWEAVALDAQGRPIEVLAAGALPTTDAHIHHELALPASKAAAHGIGISVAVRGQADLELRALGMAVD